MFPSKTTPELRQAKKLVSKWQETRDKCSQNKINPSVFYRTPNPHKARLHSRIHQKEWNTFKVFENFSRQDQMAWPLHSKESKEGNYYDKTKNL